MFILPSNKRKSVLQSALEGLNESASILKEQGDSRRAKQSREKLPEEYRNILNAGLHPSESKALIESLSQYGLSNPIGDERGLSPSPAPGRGFPDDEGVFPEGDYPTLKRRAPLTPYERQQLRRAGGMDLLKAEEQTLRDHNLREQKLSDYNKRTIATPLFQQARSGQDMLLAADRLKRLNDSGQLMSPAANWVQQLTGIPLAILGGPEDEVFKKETESLLPVYLRRNYSGLGRILLAEVNAQARAIVRGDNSPEAKRRLIEAIYDLAQASIDSVTDYKKAVKKYGSGSPDLDSILYDLAQNRVDKKRSDRLIDVTDKLGRTYSIKHKDLPEWEAIESLDGE